MCRNSRRYLCHLQYEHQMAEGHDIEYGKQERSETLAEYTAMCGGDISNSAEVRKAFSACTRISFDVQVLYCSMPKKGIRGILAFGLGREASFFLDHPCSIPRYGEHAGRPIPTLQSYLCMPVPHRVPRSVPKVAQPASPFRWPGPLADWFVALALPNELDLREPTKTSETVEHPSSFGPLVMLSLAIGLSCHLPYPSLNDGARASYR